MVTHDHAFPLAINKRPGHCHRAPRHAQLREAHPGMHPVPGRDRGAGAACPALFL